MNEIRTHTVCLRIVRRYFAWLLPGAADDVSQTVWVAVLEHRGEPLPVVRRAAVLGCERLARDLGWRRTRDSRRRRVWMRESQWLRRGPRRQGAPLGNTNRRRP